MDKYMIVFRWLAQVGGASRCMYLTETTLAAAVMWDNSSITLKELGHHIK